jgi:hypothetical protein
MPVGETPYKWHLWTLAGVVPENDCPTGEMQCLPFFINLIMFYHMKDYDIMTLALRDMQDEDIDISIMQCYITKRTGIYSIDSLVFGHYVVRRFKEDN